MRKLTEYPTLSLKERDRRWATVRAEMEKRGLDCLVLCGWPAMWDFNIANARYLCPIGGNAEHNVLVFPLSGEPTTFIYSPVFTDYWKGAQSWVARRPPAQGQLCRQHRRSADRTENDRRQDRHRRPRRSARSRRLDAAQPLHPAEGSHAGREPRQSRRHDGEASRGEKRRRDRGARQGCQARRPDARSAAATPLGPASRNARSMPA